MLQQTPFQRGLAVSLYGEDWTTYRRPKRMAQFDAGIKEGLEIVREMGGMAQFRRIMARTAVMQARTRESFSMLQRMLGRGEQAEREEWERMMKLEPCSDCRNIAICAVTGRSCVAFDQYVANGWVNPQADRTPTALARRRGANGG